MKSQRVSFSACIVVMYAIVALSASQPASVRIAESERKRTEFGMGIEAGHGLHKYNDTCIMFRVFFISGDFFVGLHKIETPSGTEFQKDRARLDTFPDPLIIDVEATVFRCVLEPNRLVPPDYAASLMSGAVCEVSWKIQESKIRPIALLSTQERHKSPGLRWDYFLHLHANGSL